MHPIEHGRSGNIFDIIAKLETTQQPVKVSHIVQVRPKSANLKKPLAMNSAAGNVPPTPGLQCAKYGFTPAADDLQIPTKIIFAGLDTLSFGVPTIITGANAYNARPCSFDPLKIEIEPIFLHDVVGMKDENPIIVLTKAFECRIDRAVLPKSLPILQDCKPRHANPRIGSQSARIVRARIIADEYATKLRNARTRLKSSHCLFNGSGGIEGRDDDRCAHPIIVSANYFCTVIQGLIPDRIS
jgi:hypothetical protein